MLMSEIGVGSCLSSIDIRFNKVSVRLIRKRSKRGKGWIQLLELGGQRLFKYDFIDLIIK